MSDETCLLAISTMVDLKKFVNYFSMYIELENICFYEHDTVIVKNNDKKVEVYLSDNDCIMLIAEIKNISTNIQGFYEYHMYEIGELETDKYIRSDIRKARHYSCEAFKSFQRFKNVDGEISNITKKVEVMRKEKLINTLNEQLQTANELGNNCNNNYIEALEKIIEDEIVNLNNLKQV